VEKKGDRLPGAAQDADDGRLNLLSLAKGAVGPLPEALNFIP